MLSEQQMLENFITYRDWEIEMFGEAEYNRILKEKQKAAHLESIEKLKELSLKMKNEGEQRNDIY